MSVAEELKKTELFKEVDLTDLEALVTRMESHQFEGGQTLFHEGDTGDTMYIIQEGRIRITMRGKEGEEIILTHYKENEIFGELSPIDQRPRSASAIAEDFLRVLALDRTTFLNFLAERPQIGVAMMRSLSQRLRNTTTFIEEYRVAKEAPVATTATGRTMFSRGGARGGAAVDLFDRISKDEESGPTAPLLDLPPAVEVPYEADGSPTQANRAVNVEETPSSTDTQRIARMGIFDRIAAPLQERLEKEKKEG
jgi:CRP-like cAMP-binding protein